MSKELEVDIDFDEASREWRKNKIPTANGCFTYRCNYVHQNGKQCNKVVASQTKQSHYRIRPDWTKSHFLESFAFCSRHVIRGTSQ